MTQDFRLYFFCGFCAFDDGALTTEDIPNYNFELAVMM